MWACSCSTILHRGGEICQREVPVLHPTLHRNPRWNDELPPPEGQYDIIHIHHTQWPWIVWSEFMQMLNPRVKDSRGFVRSLPRTGFVRVMCLYKIIFKVCQQWWCVTANLQDVSFIKQRAVSLWIAGTFVDVFIRWIYFFSCRRAE